VNGINGGSQTKDILILSTIPDGVGDYYFDGREKEDDEDKGRPRRIEWKCVDGTRGTVQSDGIVKNPSPVVQIIPLTAPHKHASGCHQVAMIIHEDDSITFFPNNESTMATAFDHLDRSKNGMYSHIIDKKTNTVRSMKIDANKKISKYPLAPFAIGKINFGSGEEIVSVAYPTRDEVIQSPCNILGDDSLLLKYINPHMAVVVTVTKVVPSGGLLSVLEAQEPGTIKKGQRTPLGVDLVAETQASEKTGTKEKPPNLFINVIDTVSAKVLYRASHKDASPVGHVPVLINENRWVIYSYFNSKTRRTDIGVLTLHEGMIDNKGITPFASPDQVTEFSSMASDSKPVVLAKTFALHKVITALGVSATKSGISSRHIYAATKDDKIVAIDRRLLDPRRPSGELKETEKQEGLVRYYPMIPVSPQFSPTYNRTVHGIKSMTSTSTALESQSFLLAFGGADVFFTRVAPSKGFDLLPESFNRSLLLLVVIALLGVLVAVLAMSKKKVVTQGWS